MEWMRECRVVLLVGACGLTGCAAYTQRELANPTPLHREPSSFSSMADMSATGRPEPDRKLDDESVEASRLIAQRYYAAMAKAKADPPVSGAIGEYVNTGTKLVQLHCLRWFGRVAEAQRNMELGNTNRNVISQLGTTLIGIGKLHSDVTTVYGGVNTAIAGLSSNFSSAFLAAPNSESVKRLVMEALRSRAALLTDSSSPIYPKDFSSAYLELEKLADTCTHAEVKKMTTETVDKSKATADPNSGEIRITAADLRFQAANESRVNKLLDRVDKLTPEQALALTQILPFRNDPVFSEIIKRDAGNNRVKDPNAAKSVAKELIALTANSDFRFSEWENILSRFD